MPIVKKVNLSPKKKFSFPPQEEFERVVKRAQRSDRRTNILLHPNASAAEKVKYNLCKNITRYARENNLTEKELAKKLGITHAKVEKILFCHIGELTLEELVDYLADLAIPLKMKVDNKYVWEKISPQAH